MRLTKDVFAGLMFISFGIGAAVIAQNYSLGTLARMGSGYFPMMIGGLIATMGSAILVRAVVWPDSSEPIATIEFRPVFFIGAAIVIFGLVIDDFGIIAALAALIIIARFAGREGGAVELVAMVVVLTVVVVGIFVYGLNIHLKLWPS
jgi:hypothetical protein